MKNLSDFVKDNSKFLRLSNGESFDGTYLGYKVTSIQFDPDKETCIYKMKYEDGKEVFWQTSSVGVARTLSKFQGGEKVKIVRNGEGNKTRYEVTSPDVELPTIEG